MISCSDGGCKERHLVLLHGSVGLTSTYLDSDNFHISVLGKLGIRESWINLFIVVPLPFGENPIGVGKKNNKVFFSKRHKDLVCVDLRSQTVETLGVKGDGFDCHVGKYTKSFLPIGGINN